MRVDGREVPLPEGAETEPLAEVLRAAGVVSVKQPCGEGGCGGCTVLLDGTPVVSCVVPATRARGREVRTAASLTLDGVGERLAAELARKGALQCGFCVPGLLASATALVESGAPVDRAELAERLSGHLCRCTGYEGLLDAVERVVRGEHGGAGARTDGAAKASGACRFAADALPPDGLHAVLLTCQSPHALVTVDPGSAMDVPGAVAVLGPDDAPERRYSTNPHVEDPVLAPEEDQVLNREGRFVGDVVGLVVAETAAAARRMADLVDQHEEPLPAVLDLDAALADGAPSVRLGEPNVAFSFVAGSTADEVDEAIASAPHVVEEVVELEPGPIAAMERPAAVAVWDDDGIRVWSTSQTPQVARRRTAAVLGVPVDDVEMEPVALGGGFGLKEETFLEPIAALASRACGGRAVLVQPSRRQLGRLRRRHGARVRMVTACADDGAILARSVHIDLDAGGQVGHTALVLENAALVALQLHRAPHVRVTGRAVLTNTTTSGAFRGYGAGEVGFAMETHLDGLARRFGIDPLEYRRRHVMVAGETDRLNGWTVPSFASLECLDALAASGWGTPLAPDPSGRWRRGRGLGLLCIVSAASSAAHSDVAEAACRVDPDGSVVVETVVADMGQGNHSGWAAVAAERLGLPVEQVRIEQRPASQAPEDEGTFASRGVFVTGNAVADAADRLVASLVERAEALTGIPSTRFVLDAGRVVGGEAVLDLATLAAAGPLRASGRSVAADNGLVVGAQMAEVSVDTWTGRVVVDRVVSAHDVGRVLDLDLATGQVVGGVVQGMGIALGERLRHDASGDPIEVDLLDQPIPTAGRAPRIEAVFVGDGRATGALGAKGLGEAPMVGMLAAVGNAVADAVGSPIGTAPFVAERVLAALDERAGVDADPSRGPAALPSAPSPT